MNVKMALGEIKIRKEYDIKKLNPRKNPYSKKKKQVLCSAETRAADVLEIEKEEK
ncbi:hypothetical protein [Roseburia intestinalis]